MTTTAFTSLFCAAVATLAVSSSGASTQLEILFETTTPYHHIQVIDRNGMRTLHFDNSSQSRISLEDPLQGQFEYTEYFHMPWLWNPKIKTVLLMGLGGSSIQRAYQAYHPEVETLTVELDPKVVEIARDYFGFKETEKMKVVIGDGRQHLRRTRKTYDLIILDAYTANRYGSYIPYSLTSREFFALARDHLNDQGILAYNVIGSVRGRTKNIVGAIYKTLKTSFSHVYLFPAIGSTNVVLIATTYEKKVTLPQLRARIWELTAQQETSFPRYETRLKRYRYRAPSSAARSNILTDDFAPVDGLLEVE